MEIPIDMQVRKDFIEHMIREEQAGGKEACGLLTLSKGYVPIENVAVDPTLNFAMSPDDSFRVINDPDVIAYCHTHPAGMLCASKDDMANQMLVGKPMIIAGRHHETGVVEIFQVGDHLLDEPLEGKSFRFNSYDCYECGRRYYWQERKIKLLALPRNMYFWFEQPANNLFMDHMLANGFERFNPEQVEPEIGDAVLYQTDGALVINHCGVYVGNNLLLHHRAGRKSNKTPMTFYQGHGYLRMWLRHTGKQP